MTAEGRFPRLPIDEKSLRTLYVRLAAGEVLVLFPAHLTQDEREAAAAHAVPLTIELAPLDEKEHNRA